MSVALITRVGFSSVVTPATGATSATFTAPTGTAASGDFWVLDVAIRGTVGLAAPTGWTLRYSSLTGDTAATPPGKASIQTFTAPRGASNPGLVFNSVGGAAINVLMGRITSYRGVDATTPVAGGVAFLSATNALTVSTSQDILGGEMIHAAVAGGDNTTVTSVTINPVGVSTAMTEFADTNTATGGDTTLALYDWLSPHAQTARTITATLAGTSFHAIGVIRLKPATVAAATYYVSTTGNDSTGNGLTEGTAWLTLNKAATSSLPGDTIIALPGTYPGTLTITKGGVAGAPLVIKSKYKWGARIIPPATSGSNDGIWIDAPYVDFDGFEVDGTLHQAGTRWVNGINARQKSVRVLNCWVHHIYSDNTLALDSNGGSGITLNGFVAGYQDAEAINCLVHHCGFVGNNFVHGIYLQQIGGKVKNCIVHNVGRYGIIGYHDLDNNEIVHNTVFACDTGIGVVAGGYYNKTGGVANVKVHNNIAYSNTLQGIYASTDGQTFGAGNTYTNNCANANGTNVSLSAGTETGTVTTSPLFVNYQSNGTGNYRLQSGSPCVNGGTSSNATTTDYLGVPRSTPDIGAYERTTYTADLTESFGSLDTAKWDQFGSGYTVENGALKFVVNNTLAYGGLITKTASPYTFTGSSVFVKLLDLPAYEGDEMGFSVFDAADTGAGIEWLLAHDIMVARTYTGGSFTNHYFPSTGTARWFRLREMRGDLFWDYAPDSASNPPIESDWVNLGQIAAPFNTAATVVQLYGGRWQAGATDTTMRWDAVNTSYAISSGAVTFSGTAAMGAYASGSLTTSKLLAGAAAIAATVSGTPTTAKPLSGAVQAAATAAGALTNAKPLSGAVQAAAAAAGLMTTARPLSGNVQASTAVTGVPTTAKPLSGAAQAAAVASGSLTNALPLAGTAAAIAAAAGSLTTGIPLAGTASVRTYAAGTPTTAVAFYGTAEASLRAFGAFGSAAAVFAGTAIVTARAQAALTTSIALQGTADAIARASGVMRQQATFTGQAAATATGAASLATAKPLGGTAQIALQADGALSTGIALGGGVSLGVEASAALQTAITFGGAVDISVLAEAFLKTGITVPPALRVWTVVPQDRAWVVMPQDRTYQVPPQDRAYTAAAQDRSRVVTPQERTYEPTPQDRKVTPE